MRSTLAEIGEDLEELANLVDDGLETPDVGDWSELKYEYIQTYAELFIGVTRGKWKNRVYIDLFAGAGRARLKKARRIVPSSSYLALGIQGGFERFIFCDLKLDALKARVARDFPSSDARFVAGDVNAKAAEILSSLPPFGPTAKSLALCLVDPFNFGNLKFATIRALAARYMDFLVLIPAGYDGNRNKYVYIEGASEKLDHFLGDTTWREVWERETLQGPRSFSRFVIDQFGERMKGLDFKYENVGDAAPIRLPGKNVLLYSSMQNIGATT